MAHSERVFTADERVRSPIGDAFAKQPTKAGALLLFAALGTAAKAMICIKTKRVSPVDNMYFFITEE